MSLYSQKINDALAAPFIRNSEGMERFKKLITDLEDGSNEKAYEQAAKVLTAKIFAYMHKPVELGRKEGAAAVKKNFESLTGRRVETLDVYRTWTDELAMDMDWMPAFRMTSTVSNGGAPVDIIDFVGSIKVRKHDDGVDLQMSSFGKDSRTRLAHERWGTGVPFLRVWLDNNDFYTINDAMDGIRIAFQATKADEAYTALGVAGTGTTTVAAATADARITGMNSAVTTLLKRVTNSGFNVTATTPILLYSAIDHQDTVLQLFERTTAGDGAGNRPRFRVIPVFTFNSNFPTQITASKDSVNLVYPRKKNVWNSFSANRTAQEVDFSTDSIKIMAQEYFNKTVDADQVQTLNLET